MAKSKKGGGWVLAGGASRNKKGKSVDLEAEEAAQIVPESFTGKGTKKYASAPARRKPGGAPKAKKTLPKPKGVAKRGQTRMGARRAAGLKGKGKSKK